MSQTLFLSETVSAAAGEGAMAKGSGLFGRKGRFKPSAPEILGALMQPGEVTVCLPPFATQCRTLSVRAQIGRRVTQNDLADAIQAALGRAGEPSMAVVSAEPSRILLDREPITGSPVGQAAQEMVVEVAAFLSKLSFLTELEAVLAEAQLELSGVIACEEALGAAVKEGLIDAPVILLDGFAAKAVALEGSAAAASVLTAYGPAHVTQDLATTFSLGPEEAAALSKRAVLGRLPKEEGKAALVAGARLEEIANEVVEAARRAGFLSDRAIVLGLPISPPVEAAFEMSGVTVRAPGLALEKTDPSILSLAKGAGLIGAGSAGRTAATAMQLAEPSRREGILDWLRRNF
ncbi:hypothetical protein [Parvularcula maris]|uniref:SHS2 domain-containing protein n=1 Tax=Parvularcula maris TaxID=2965077 RepID=A0A9X2L8J1_9PROT|nr:hypothetical protein [Parvularcula maris]MCQ8185089.1 hypothetical protein [Parvularcula maris]